MEGSSVSPVARGAFQMFVSLLGFVVWYISPAMTVSLPYPSFVPLNGFTVSSFPSFSASPPFSFDGSFSLLPRRRSVLPLALPSAPSISASTHLETLLLRRLAYGYPEERHGLVVDLSVDNKVYPFLVDTGSSVSLVKALPSMALQRIPHPQMLSLPQRIATAAGGGFDEGLEYAYIHAQVGKRELAIPAALLDGGHTVLPAGIAGILGLNFLQQFRVVSFDFAKGILSLHDAEDAGVLNITRDMIPMKMHPMVNGSLLAIEMDLKSVSGDTEASKHLDCLGVIDLGSPQSVVNEKIVQYMDLDATDLAKKQIVDINGRVAPITPYRIKELALLDLNGRRTLLCLDCRLNGGNIGWFQAMGYVSEPVMIVGQDYLKANRLIFDFGGQVLYISRDVALGEACATGFGQQWTIPVDAAQGSVEEAIRLLQSQLIEGVVKFSSLQKELINAGVDIKQCKTTDELIALVAKLRCLGADACKAKDDESFSTALNHSVDYVRSEQYNRKYSELNDEYRLLDGHQKKFFLQRILNSLRQSGISRGLSEASDILREYANKLVNESIVDEDARRQAIFSSEGSNPMGVSSYAEMAKYLQKSLTTAQGSDRGKLLNAYRKELRDRLVDFNDCKSDREIANRLAYARVFKSQKGVSDRKQNKNRGSMDSSRASRSNSRAVTASSSSAFSSLLDSPFDRIFEEFFGGFSLFGPSLKRSLFSNNGEDSIIIQLGGFEGDGGEEVLRGREEERLSFRQDHEKKGDASTAKEKRPTEKHPLLLKLLSKAQTLGDSSAYEFLQRSLQEAPLRSILLRVCEKGFSIVQKECETSGDSKALYVLHKLKDANIL